MLNYVLGALAVVAVMAVQDRPVMENEAGLTAPALRANAGLSSEDVSASLYRIAQTRSISVGGAGKTRAEAVDHARRLAFCRNDEDKNYGPADCSRGEYGNWKCSVIVYCTRR